LAKLGIGNWPSVGFLGLTVDTLMEKPIELPLLQNIQPCE